MSRTKPLSIPPCPRCGQADSRWLEFTSTTNKADTFQCLACGMIWVEATPAEPAKTG